MRGSLAVVRVWRNPSLVHQLGQFLYIGPLAGAPSWPLAYHRTSPLISLVCSPPIPHPGASLGYVCSMCAQQAMSTKRRKKIGSSVA